MSTSTSSEKRTLQNRTYTEYDILGIRGIGRTSAHQLGNSRLFKTIRTSRKPLEDWLKKERLEDEME